MSYSATQWTVPAHQAPQSMEFSRQEYWSRLPVPSSRGSERKFHLPQDVLAALVLVGGGAGGGGARVRARCVSVCVCVWGVVLLCPVAVTSLLAVGVGPKLLERKP